MVQEFNVLRCFSCQTFQVQQVKKSKKWTCKVCGEKQSLIKEFGRGAAADCRRHVQKLNALRGEMQELNTENLMTGWDDDEQYENEDAYENLDQTHKSEEASYVSRWSKYTDQTAEGPNELEDEDDENIYTERHQFRSRGTRKRKKNSSPKTFGGADNSCEDEEPRNIFSAFKKRPYLPLQHDGKFSSSWNKGCASGYSSCDKFDDPCIGTNLPSSNQADCRFPTACSSYREENCYKTKQPNKTSDKPPTIVVTESDLLPTKNLSVSSHHNFGESKFEKKDSKWSTFLPIAPTQQDEEDSECQDQNYSQYDNTMMAFFPEALKDTGVDSEESRYPQDEKKHGFICVDKSVSLTNSHTSKHAASRNAICKQPPLAKAPSFSLNSLFCTDEDFDDTF